MGMTRGNTKIDTLYKTPSGSYFFTPDGDGRVYYDTLDEAREDTGITSRVIVLKTEPEDY